MLTNFNVMVWLVSGLLAVVAYCAFDSLALFWPSWYQGNLLNRSPTSVQFCIIIGLSVFGVISFIFVAGLYALGGMQKVSLGKLKKPVEQKK